MPSRLERPLEGAGERPGHDALRPGPGVGLGPQRPSRRIARVRGRILDDADDVANRDHVEAVLGQRSGLVGDDQVDRAENLLGVQAPDEHAALEEPV